MLGQTEGGDQMSLWKRAAGRLKDRNSIWVANLSKRSSCRNPDLEAAIIKATSHDEWSVDYTNAHRVFQWIRTSPVSLKPLVWALSKRMEKTRSWVVALKGLILMHGVFCCKIPAVQRMGRLPFNLSNFTDGHSRPNTAWGFNSFIRSYYSFLDQRSAFFYEQTKQTEEAMVQELAKLQNLQNLLDLLLQIKPQSDNMQVTLILEAMDCVVIEIYDVYSRICNGIARALLRIHSSGKLEISMALKLVEKATEQGEEISLYFEFCKEFGILNILELPKVKQIPEEEIRVLQRLLNGVPENSLGKDSEKKNECDLGDADFNAQKAIVVKEDNCKSFFDAQKAIMASEDTFKARFDAQKAMVVKEDSCITDRKQKLNNTVLRTIITDKWEVFDEELKMNESNDQFSNERTINPFGDLPTPLPLVPVTAPAAYNRDLPDLIRF